MSSKVTSLFQQYLSTFKWNQILNHLTSVIFSVIMISICFIIIHKLGSYFISKGFKHQSKNDKDNNDIKRNSTLHSLSLTTFKYLLAFLWLYSVLSSVGVPIGTLLASASIFSVAIGIGAQGFVTDIVSGFFILFEKQINIGEYITVTTPAGQLSGTVSEIGLRSTKLTGFDGTINFIPNRQVTAISNISKGDMWALVIFRINPDSPIDKIYDVIREVNAKYVPQHPEILEDPTIWGTIILQDNNPAIQVNIHTSGNGAQVSILHEFLKLYFEAITAHGIDLPKTNAVIKPSDVKGN